LSLNLDDLGPVQGVLRLDVMPDAAGGSLSQLEPLATDNGWVIGINLAFTNACRLASDRVEMPFCQAKFPENSSDFPQSLLGILVGILSLSLSLSLRLSLISHGS
jgi:hypothetical protein